MAFAHAGMVDVSLLAPPDSSRGPFPRQGTLLLESGNCQDGKFRADRFHYTGGGDAWMVGIRPDDGPTAMPSMELEYTRPRAKPRPPAPAPLADGASGLRGGDLPLEGRRCLLAGISVHRLAPDEEAYELRLQYEGCRDDSGSTHPEKAAVTVSVERRGNCSSNLVPWMCELSAQDVTADMTSCPAAAVDLHKETLARSPSTTTPMHLLWPSAGEVDIDIHARWKQVGPGRCSSPGLVPAEQVRPMTREECQQMCFQRLDSYAVERGRGRARCRGFAFNAGAREGSRCVLYTSVDTEVTRSDAARGGGWICWAVFVDGGDYHAKEPGAGAAPSGMDHSLAGEHVPGVRGSSPGGEPMPGGEPTWLRLFRVGAEPLPATAILRRLEPPLRSPHCFEGVDWFSLESTPGKPASVCVAETDFPALLKLVPGPLVAPHAGKAPGRVSLERVCVNTCGLNAAHCTPLQPAVVVSRVETGVVPPGIAAGIAALLTGLAACYMVYSDCCCCLTERHPKKPAYRLIMQEYMPGEANPVKSREVWHEHEHPGEYLQVQYGWDRSYGSGTPLSWGSQTG